MTTGFTIGGTPVPVPSGIPVGGLAENQQLLQNVLAFFIFIAITLTLFFPYLGRYFMDYLRRRQVKTTSSQKSHSLCDYWPRHCLSLLPYRQCRRLHVWDKSSLHFPTWCLRK